MKLLLAVVVYLVAALILGWGLLLAVKGNWVFLIVGVLAYGLALGKIGCLPKSHH